MKKKFVLIILLCALPSLSSNVTSASEIDDRRLYFRMFDTPQGLSANEIRRLHVDREGLLWLATNNGLVRYDGYSFRTFRNDMRNPSLLHSNYISTVSDDDSYIWVGTPSGINYIEKSTQKVCSLDLPELKNVYINKIISYDDKIWIATNVGLYSYSLTERKLSNLKLSDKDVIENIKDIILDSKGHMWIGAVSLGLFRLDFQSGKMVFYTKGTCSDYAHVLFLDIDGDLWIGTWGGGLVHVYNSNSPETAQYVTYRRNMKDSSSIVSDIVYSIAQDKLSGDLWVGTRYGLSILSAPYNNGYFENYISDGGGYSLSNNDVSDICQDNNGNMWLATIGGGLGQIFLNNNDVISYDPLSGIESEFKTRNITAIYHDAHNRLWLGLKNQGLVIYDYLAGRHYHSPYVQGLKKIPSASKIMSIISCNDGDDVLVGLENGGLYRVMMADGLPDRCVPIFSGYNSIIGYDYINRVFQDSNGRVWISHGYDISVLDKDYQVEEARILKDKFSTTVTCFAESSDGSIWAGSRSLGVFRISYGEDGPVIRNYSIASGTLNFNYVLSVFVDKDDNVWVGTQGGGLSRYDAVTDSFICANDQLSVPYKDVFNIFQDAYGNIWLSSYDNILRVNVEAEIHTEIYPSALYPWYNIFSPECHACQISDTVFVLGGVHGLSYIKPDSTNDQEQTSPLVITDVRIGYNSIYDNPSSLYDGCSYASGVLTLDHKQKDFSVEYASLSYEAIHNDQYAYRLLGYEDEWNFVGTEQRIANYTNISSGKYLFQVKAAGANGVWTEEPVELQVIVKSSFWESWCACVIYLLVLIGISFYVYSIIVNKVKLRNRVMIAELEKQKNDELIKSKLDFFTNISHEFLTPLTIISCSADNMEPVDESQKNTISIIKGNTVRLQRLIRQVLDFNKTETGKLRLQVSEGNLSEFVSSICRNDFSILAQTRNIKLTCNIDGTIRGWYDSDKVDKILTNLLSNALKYNYDNSFVNLSMVEDYDENHRYAVITIQDGGIGIEPDKVDLIFDKYYSGSQRSSEAKGTGIGLALTKALVECHKGTISVESVLGRGSEFTVVLPINEKTYLESERAVDVSQNEELEFPDEGGGGTTILVVEDNNELRYLIAQHLSRLYAVECAENGQEAINKLEQHQFDLVVMDWMMPVMDGKDLCHYMRTNIEYSHIPIIMLTAKSSTEDRITSYNIGVDAFISKPFQMSLLVTRIDNLLRRRELMIKDYSSASAEDNSIQLKTIAYTSLDEKFIQTAVKIVEENIANEDFSLDDFYNVMNVSKSTLYRKLKLLVGMSTNEFIKDIRLKHACKIMKGQKVSVSEIAYQVGFSQPKYFTYCFKKKYGLLPSEYMDLHKHDLKD